ncbi:MAG: HlyD family efflux transporter periplasmic adaptor subunit [Spongiibacteraceae bacterium]
MTTSPVNPQAQGPLQQRALRRRVAMISAASIFTVIGLVAAVWWFIEMSHYQSTDDAYVNGNVVTITPQVAGTVIAISAENTDLVHAGDELVALDEADVKVALDQAEASLAQTVREVHSRRVTNASLSAEVELREAQLVKAEQDLVRRKDLASSGAVSSEELHHVETAVKAARSDLLAAREKLATNRALTGDGEMADNPQVLHAAANVRSAYMNWRRTAVPAPVSGYVAKRSVQLGQRVQPGDALMAVVPLGEVWVDANFKESQLEDMRIGQPVVLEADIYGSSVVYHGSIAGLGAGTGSAFSLLPAQNATGNWIKVVQRVPVRVVLDAKELAQHPLRLGLSVTAKVDISDLSGHQLATQSRPGKAYQTNVYADLDSAADQRVAAIIIANNGVHRESNDDFSVSAAASNRVLD